MSISKFKERLFEFVSEDCLGKGFSNNPLKEIAFSVDRSPIRGFHKGGSLGGRFVCLIMIPVHFTGIVIKPSLYAIGAAGGIIAFPISLILSQAVHKEKLPEKIRPTRIFVFIFAAASCALLSPFGQIAQTCKAVAGVFHPGAYFRTTYWIDNQDNNNPQRRNSAFKQLEIEREELEKNPQKILKNIAKDIKTLPKKRPWELRVKFKNEKGSDFGGVRRDFIDSLLSHLSKEYNLDSEEILAFNDENKNDIANLGIVLEMLLRGINKWNSRTETPIPEGCIHHDYFVNILKFSYKELQGGLKGLSPQRIFQLLNERHVGDDLGIYYQNCIELLNWNGSSENRAESFQMIIDTINSVKETDYAFNAKGGMDNRSLKALKRDMFKEALLSATDLKTIHILAKTICRSKNQWERLQELKAERLENHLMGDTWHSNVFIQRIKIQQGDGKAAVMNWLQSLSPSDQKAFVRFVTGSGALPTEYEEINICFTYSEGKPVAHTCSKCVDISMSNDIEDSIAYMQDYFIKSQNMGFEIA